MKMSPQPVNWDTGISTRRCVTPLPEKMGSPSCRTLLPVINSPTSPPQHEKGPSLDTPWIQPTQTDFHASYHVQDTRLYQKVSEVRFAGCMVCGHSVYAIKKEKVYWYIRRSTPQNEPEHVTDSEEKRSRMVLTQVVFFL